MVEGFSISSDIDRKNQLKCKNRCISLGGADWRAAISDALDRKARGWDGVGDKD